jgi:hypothetical protein
LKYKFDEVQAYRKSMLWILAIIAITASVVLVLWATKTKPIISNSIRSKVSSVVLVPNGDGVVVDKATVVYDSSLKLLSYKLTYSGTNLVASEQPSPDTFTDLPQAYDKVLANMNEYSKFETDTGTVHLTKPTDLKGKQAAVLNTKGTLMFVKPSSNLTDDQWRTFFKNLQVIK